MVRVERRPARALRRPVHTSARTSGTPAGGRRSPTPSTSTCAMPSAWSTSPPSTSSTSRAPGAFDFLQYMTVNSVNVPVGRSVYTPLLTPTVASGPTSPSSGSPTTTSGSSPARSTVAATSTGSPATCPTTAASRSPTARRAMCTIGVWGPKAQATMAKIVTGQHEPYDLTQEGFPYGHVREVLIDGVPCTMFRISYVGENGWEVYTNAEHGLRVWDSIAEAGEEFDLRPVGIGVYAVTGRIEKGYRLMGAELESEYNPVEAGLARPRRSRAPTSSARPPTSRLAMPNRSQRCARSRSPTTPLPRVSPATRPAATSRSSPPTASASSTPTAALRGSRRPGLPPRSTRTCSWPTCHPSTPSRARSWVSST